jgi:hypothetical protein
MGKPILTDAEVIVLKAIEALGGEAHISELKGAVRWQARGNAHKVLAFLSDDGLVNRYARGCYVLTEVGRTVLAALSANAIERPMRHD